MLKALLLLAVVAFALWRLRHWLAGTPRGGGAMTLAQARALLGVGPADGEEAIRRAHRAQITAVHPDRGGAGPEAARLNAARDMALRAAQERTQNP